MEIISFTDGEYLKKDALREGYVYLVKDGRVMVYLGKSVEDKFVFYVVCSAVYKGNGSFHSMTIANANIQIKYIIEMLKSSMNNQADCDCFVSFKNMPSLCCVFPYIEFSASYESWYLKNKMMCADSIPMLASLNNGVKKKFVGAKELIPGQCYYSGGCWRSCFCYLGRTGGGGFVWYFIGNWDIFMNATVEQLVMKSEYTKNNKKVRPLADALTDEDAYVSEDTKAAILNGVCKSPSGIQQCIDRRYNGY